MEPANYASNEKMRHLETIEGSVYQLMNHATMALNEFGKDKSSIKNVENHANQFLKSLENVETHVSKHLQNLSKVSTLHPHEGSCYSSNKVNQMSLQRLEHVRSCLNELEHLKHQHQMQNQKFQTSRNQKMEKNSEGGEKVQIKSETN